MDNIVIKNKSGMKIMEISGDSVEYTKEFEDILKNNNTNVSEEEKIEKEEQICQKQIT